MYRSTIKHAKTENYKNLFEDVALVQITVKTVTHVQSTFNKALCEMMVAADIPLCRCGFSNFAGKGYRVKLLLEDSCFQRFTWTVGRDKGYIQGQVSHGVA